MQFITQGRTNWKFLLIVVILAVIVGGGALILINNQEFNPIQSTQVKESNTVSVPKIDIFLTTDKTEYLPWNYIELIYSSKNSVYSDNGSIRSMRRQVYIKETGEWKYLDEDLSNELRCEFFVKKDRVMNEIWEWEEMGAWYKDEKTESLKFRIVYYYSTSESSYKDNCKEIKMAYSNEFILKKSEAVEEKDNYFKYCFEESKQLEEYCIKMFKGYKFSSPEDCSKNLLQRKKDICLAIAVSSAGFNEKYSYYCKNIADSLLKDYCYKKIAVLSGKNNFCSEINDNITKQNCNLLLNNKAELKIERNKECLTSNDCMLDCGSCVNKKDNLMFVCDETYPAALSFTTPEIDYNVFCNGCPEYFKNNNLEFGNNNLENERNYKRMISDVCKYLTCYYTSQSQNGQWCGGGKERIEDCECKNNICEKIDNCGSINDLIP